MTAPHPLFFSLQLIFLFASIVNKPQKADGSSAFDSLRFHPASKSYFSGSAEGFEKKWLRCMQELEELKEKGAYDETNGSSEEEQEEEADSYEKNYPPNYKPAFHYGNLHISDIIYPLKLHKVPNYPRHFYGYDTVGYGHKKTRLQSNGTNDHGESKYGPKKEEEYKPEGGHVKMEKKGGSKEEKNAMEYDHKKEEKAQQYGPENEDGYGHEEDDGHGQGYNEKDGEYEKGSQLAGEEDGEYGHEEGKEAYQNENHGESEEKEDSLDEKGHYEEEGEEGNEEEVEHQYSKEEDEGENQSDEPPPYASPEDEEEGEEEDGKDKYENNPSAEGKEGSNEEEEEGYVEDDNDEEEPPHKEPGHHRHVEPAHPPFAPPPAAPQQPPQIPPVQMPPLGQPNAQMSPQQASDGSLGAPQQQPVPINQLPPQIPPLTAPVNNQPVNPPETTVNSSCRLEPMELCSGRAHCPETAAGQMAKDCTLVGDDLIFDGATQDCKSIVGVPECQKDPYCSGKPLGWTPVGGQCTKVAYMCAVPTASSDDQQQTNKLLCPGATIVNIANPSKCIQRTMAGC